MGWKWAKKAIIGILASVIFLVLSCISFQYVITKIDDFRYPPQGKLVDVGGYCLHIHTTGEAHKKATVVLESGLGCSSLDWAFVQPEVAKFAKVCSYDRAGYGWSEQSPHPRTSLQIVQELHTLLKNANIPPPYILVGHSFGGVNVRLFANLYPDEVLGIVLVDSSHEMQFEKIPSSLRQSFLKKYTDLKNPTLWKIVAPLGLQRILSIGTEWVMPTSSVAKTIYQAKNATTKYFHVVNEEFSNFKESLMQLQKSKSRYCNKPLYVLSAGKAMNLEKLGVTKEWTQEFFNSWRLLQDDLVTQSTRSKLKVAENSDHMIPWHEPETIVGAIREIVDVTK